jgi:5-methyltetrahydrofolate--homocysteine methyltransferase
MNLYERLDRGDLVLGDGAMGTMLQEAGLDDGGASELWNVERPDPVAEILAGYAESGAQYLTTNTFGGTAARLELHGLGERAEELSRAGAEVARGVADRFGIMVAGDIGPTGEILFPLGVMEQDEAQRLFEVQIRGLQDGGADFLLIETMSALEEVEAAVRAAQAVAPELPIAVTMSFDTNLRTMMGVTPAQAVQTISGWGVRVVGANCGRGPGEIETIMGEMAEARPDGIHLMAQSNAGLPKLVGDVFAYDGTPEVMAGYARRVRELGIAVIGGCCGSTPAHIAAMRDALAVSA